MHHRQRVVGFVVVVLALRAGDVAAGPSINHAPSVACRAIYRTYPGFPISIPGGGSDPDGDALRYSATSLPDGGQLNPVTGVYSWRPALKQLGPFYVPFTVTDDGVPPQSADGVLPLKVSPLDLCTQPHCDPGSGCTSVMIPLTQPCCIDEPTTRVAEPMVGCPQGRVLLIGRNENLGFGRLQNCDRLRLITFGQVAQPSIRLRLRARCLNVRQALTVHGQLESSLPTRGVILDLAGQFRFDVADAGFAEVLVNFPIPVSGPFFDFDNSDALLSVDVTDVDGLTVQEQVRVTLRSTTTMALPDLPDVDATGPTPPFVCGFASGTPLSTPSPTPSQTSQPLPTESPTPGETPISSPTPSATLIPTVRPTTTRTPTPCIGDCDGSGVVSETDLLALMEIALGGSLACIDAAGDVTVIGMLSAVNSARRGCGATTQVR